MICLEISLIIVPVFIEFLPYCKHKVINNVESIYISDIKSILCMCIVLENVNKLTYDTQPRMDYLP